MLKPEEFRDAAAVQFSLAGPDVTFAMGERGKRLSDGTPIAFAVWNGSQGDRNGIKAFSTWYRLGLSPR